jgi:hypothetical protein
VTALAQVAAAVEPALAEHAVEDPGEGELEAIVGGGDRAFVIEAIREGYLLHYGDPRVFNDMDPDLRLLAGDALFALGLERLASSGDLEAVAELSDLISQSARAEAEGRRQAVSELWRAAAERLSRHVGDR